MQTKTKKIVYCAIFIAIGTVISIFTIKFGDIFELSFAPVAVFLASVMLGPVYGAVCGIMSDFLGTILVGLGYNPIFAITWCLYGLIPALIIKKIPASFIRSLATISLTQVVCSVVLNTLWIYIFYGPGLTIPRLIGSLCSLAVYVVLFYFLQKKLGKYSLRKYPYKTENPM